MKFSIITVNYNNCSELKATIQSVLEQTCSDYEYIVIDGGSTDGSRELLQSYTNRISYWVSEKDGGIYNGMNKGIAAAHGEYCLFLNSGDTFYSNQVLEQVADQLDADIVCGNACLSKDSKYIWTAPDTVDESFWLNRFSICHQSAFIRTQILKEHPYDESFRIVADYASFFYETVVNKRSYKHVDLLISYYDCSGISSNHQKADAEKIKVLDKYRYLGYIPEDTLLSYCKRLKFGGRRYRLALAILKYLSHE